VSVFARTSEAAGWLRSKECGGADVAVVLGSGLGDFAGQLGEALTIPYGDIPHFPASRVMGHAGTLVAGTLAGKKVLALSGRVHVYEGHDMDAVTFAVRTIARLGVPRVILTNAAGGISPNCARGALMVIDDHINFMGKNPLVGPNDDRDGVRFPDMTYVYSPQLRRIADEAAAAAGVPVQHGVYIAVLGPSYETPAEIRAFRALGADAVGMSTVPEAIALRHLGVDVLGISCITNAAAGVFPEPLHHAEVMETTQQVKGQFMALLEGIIGRL
jgi:purine-nucleoside phosphorylase